MKSRKEIIESVRIRNAFLVEDGLQQAMTDVNSVANLIALGAGMAAIPAWFIPGVGPAIAGGLGMASRVAGAVGTAASVARLARSQMNRNSGELNTPGQLLTSTLLSYLPVRIGSQAVKRQNAIQQQLDDIRAYRQQKGSPPGGASWATTPTPSLKRKDPVYQAVIDKPSAWDRASDFKINPVRLIAGDKRLNDRARIERALAGTMTPGELFKDEWRKRGAPGAHGLATLFMPQPALGSAIEDNQHYDASPFIRSFNKGKTPLAYRRDIPNRFGYLSPSAYAGQSESENPVTLLQKVLSAGGGVGSMAAANLITR